MGPSLLSAEAGSSQKCHVGPASAAGREGSSFCVVLLILFFCCSGGCHRGPHSDSLPRPTHNRLGQDWLKWPRGQHQYSKVPECHIYSYILHAYMCKAMKPTHTNMHEYGTNVFKPIVCECFTI